MNIFYPISLSYQFPFYPKICLIVKVMFVRHKKTQDRVRFRSDNRETDSNPCSVVSLDLSKVCHPSLSLQLRFLPSEGLTSFLWKCFVGCGFSLKKKVIFHVERESVFQGRTFIFQLPFCWGRVPERSMKVICMRK